MNWTLIVFLFLNSGGSSSTPNILALTNVPGFRTEELCMDAGQKMTEIFSIERRSGQYRYACLRQQ